MNDNPGFPRDSAYALYVSQEHECSYLPDEQARTLFLDPSARVDDNLYQHLIDRGFRRSGQYLYQPACPQCEACISLRIPTRDFEPNRSQRRNWQINQSRFAITPCPVAFSPEHFALYNKYQTLRHTDGAMACSEPDQYMKFLTCEWANTLFYEFRQDDVLAAVAVTDLLPNGLSSIYTFFDPDRHRDGLGVFAILWQIQQAAALGKQWIYPGFWIEGCNKMNYKSQYRPLEAWNGKTWLRFSQREPLTL
ncbi:MAG: arginyltransferase [Chromatiales bacterium]|jgi:arginine-tRNA-protein transferase